MHGRKIKVKIHCKFDGWVIGSKSEQKNWKIKKTRKKNNRKNRIVKNRLKFWKNRPVRFWFYKPETKKTEPNPNKKNKKKNRAKPKKPSQTRKNRAKTESNRAKTEPNQKNRAKPVLTSFCPKKQNRTETGLFEPVSVFL